MSDCDCADGRLTAQDAAADLYQLAALMLGDERLAAELVEAAVGQVDIDPCAETKASIDAAREHLVKTTVSYLSRTDPSAFEAPEGNSARTGCIEDDDLNAAGISADELAGLLRDPGRGALREWLNRLPVSQRAVFVLRAILGWDNTKAGALLTQASGQDWEPGQVSGLFRQALCSLATSLAHSTRA